VSHSGPVSCQIVCAAEWLVCIMYVSLLRALAGQPTGDTHRFSFVEVACVSFVDCIIIYANLLNHEV
jgi:hypothetical protein